VAISGIGGSSRNCRTRAVVVEIAEHGVVAFNRKALFDAPVDEQFFLTEGAPLEWTALCDRLFKGAHRVDATALFTKPLVSKVPPKAAPTSASAVGLVLKDPSSYFVPSKPSFIFRHPNPTSEHIVKHGIFESHVIELAKKYVTPTTDFIDIGAHAGTFALSLAPLCRMVFAFEAQRMTYYQLCGGIALNQYENIIPTLCALSDHDHMVDLQITSDDGGGTTVDSKIPVDQSQPVIRTERCVAKSLDAFGLFTDPADLAPRNVKIGLIKIDVEGHELAVLKGARKTLACNNYPPILFEAWPDEWFSERKKALVKYVQETLGYSVITQVEGTHNMFLATREVV
jgi:FkbM family methyltransferase